MTCHTTYHDLSHDIYVSHTLHYDMSHNTSISWHVTQHFMTCHTTYHDMSHDISVSHTLYYDMATLKRTNKRQVFNPCTQILIGVYNVGKHAYWYQDIIVVENVSWPFNKFDYTYRKVITIATLCLVNSIATSCLVNSTSTLCLVNSMSTLCLVNSIFTPKVACEYVSIFQICKKLLSAQVLSFAMYRKHVWINK